MTGVPDATMATIAASKVDTLFVDVLAEYQATWTHQSLPQVRSFPPFPMNR